MGLLDNMTSALNRGKDAAERTGRSTRLKMQLNDLVKQRRELAAQLGASLYDVVKDNPTLREGRETILDGMAAIDEQRAAIEQQLADIEAEASAARAAAQARAEAAQSFVCPNCGTRIANTHAFCTGCGTPIEQIRATLEPKEPTVSNPSGRLCISCGAPIREGDLFCIACGTRQPDPEETPAQEATIAPEETAILNDAANGQSF